MDTATEVTNVQTASKRVKTRSSLTLNNPMIYSSLTPAQQTQAAYLFADEVFGTDAHDFDYEIKDNAIIGRSRIVKNGDAVHNRKPHTVSVNMCVRDVPAEFVTVEMDRNAAYAIQTIARNIVERMIQSQTVEA
jgi:hypothetical protein